MLLQPDTASAFDPAKLRPGKLHARMKLFTRVFALILMLCDAAALVMANVFAVPVTMFIQQHILNSAVYQPLDPATDIHRGVHVVLSVVALALFWDAGLYTARVPWWSQIKSILKLFVFLFFVHGFITFALKIYESRLLIMLVWAFAFGLVLTLRWLCYVMAARTGQLKVQTVLIGDGDIVTDMAYAFCSDPCSMHDIHTIILRDQTIDGFDIADLPRQHHAIDIKDGSFACEPFIAENPDYFYVVSLDTCHGEVCDMLIHTLNRTNAAYAVVPSITGVNFYQMEPTYFFGHDIVMLQTRPPRVSASPFSIRRMLKRLLDIAVAGTALLLLSPLFLIVALMLKIEGQGGSVFYGGNRIGRGGKLFGCWKFRSMEPNSNHLLDAYLAADPEAAARWEKFRKLDNDPRVTTRTARFIRKASIDELPQLWNVLVGDMSLVGPRPILEDEVHYFEDKLKDYLAVQPGITGLWQVSGRNDTSFKRRVYWDSWYVRNWSLWGDIVILIKTPLVLLSQKGVR